ncbi:MAG TPA: GNAT family N-acetyltransferase [Acidimicrobiia bacterium]
MKVRPLGPADVAGICALVDADRLPGQPACTPERVMAVLTGRSTLDAWSWRQLATMRVLGVESDSGELVGAGAVGRRPSGWRHLLWLHAREDRPVLDTLLVNLLRGVRLADPVSAFSLSTELTVGLEGLPRDIRSATHEVVVARGFTGTERWLYLRGTEPSPAPALPFRRRGRSDIRVELAPGGAVVGGAELSLPTPGLGVIWWLEIDPDQRRQGYGRQLLRVARHVLGEAGATETILFVDRDSPGTPDRRPALALYLSEGFTVVDRLWSYRRGGPPPDEDEPNS